MLATEHPTRHLNPRNKHTGPNQGTTLEARPSRASGFVLWHQPDSPGLLNVGTESSGLPTIKPERHVWMAPALQARIQ
jgi:hypothetical protein